MADYMIPDPIFAEPRLAAVYDVFDSDRSDLVVYAAMTKEFAARSVLDVGCGTGTFACMLANSGCDVVGVDPALASLDVARRKLGAQNVRWIHGDASNLPSLDVDLAVMTGNVAQVFLSDDAWQVTLNGIHEALDSTRGRLIFETRDPAAKAWEHWNRDETFARLSIPGIGDVEQWTQLLDVDDELVTFETVVHFSRDAARFVSRSTLRFRNADSIVATLAACGYVLEAIREAPDRPGKEFVFIANRFT